jgi:hypothetical protein
MYGVIEADMFRRSLNNARSEIEEKRLRCFEAGAREVWLCDEDGALKFFNPAGGIAGSEQCAGFPGMVG